MSGDRDIALRLAALLPNVPRWLELRWMLRNLACEILALEEAPELSFLALERRTRSVEIVGRPDAEAIASAATRAEAAEVIAPIESADHVAAALPGWAAQPAILHALSSEHHLPAMDGRVRLLASEEVADLDVPEELHQELMLAVETARSIAAKFIDGRPVSFCYDGSETETLWDISIDTLEPFRRQGHAAACVGFMIDLMRKRGKEPIWGALEHNAASMGLAGKLGFVPADRIVVFDRL
jgi:GNAT superfamily N-acetyltransferase